MCSLSFCCWPSITTVLQKNDVRSNRHSPPQISRHPATPIWFEWSQTPRLITKLSGSAAAASRLRRATRNNLGHRAVVLLQHSTVKYPVILQLPNILASSRPTIPNGAQMRNKPESSRKIFGPSHPCMRTERNGMESPLGVAYSRWFLVAMERFRFRQLCFGLLRRAFHQDDWAFRGL